MHNIPEPPIDPMDDTAPSLAQPPADWQARVQRNQPVPAWRKAIGWLSLLLAFGLTAGTIVVLLLPPAEPAQPAPQQVAENPTDVPPTDISPTQTQELPTDTPPPTEPIVVAQGELPPTLSAEGIANLLLTPLAPLSDDAPSEVTGLRYDPFTIVTGDRPRSEFISYTAVQGDTINAIAARFSLTPESLAWCNNYRVIFNLRPGDTLRIPPVDGACHRVLATRGQSLSDIAGEYNVDPFRVIDSPFNNFFGITPDFVPPGGQDIFLPGGEGPLITWDPGYEEGSDGSGATTVTFAPGQPGSCGAVDPGGGAAWVNPLPNGVWMRGFSAGHTGIDLAAPTGTPIVAANSGPVLFSGFSNWGYGGTVVVGHGQMSTLYAHMSSRAVECGAFVSAGQVIGYVGSTGNSSGPHLHFEIRFRNTPQDPSGTPGVGW